MAAQQNALFEPIKHPMDGAAKQKTVVLLFSCVAFSSPSSFFSSLLLKKKSAANVRELFKDECSRRRSGDNP